MFIKAMTDFETATHNVRKGQIADLPAEQADAAIKRGDAVASSVEEAIADMSGTPRTERATAGPDAKPLPIKRAN